MFGDGGSDKYLGSGDEDGFASMDLGTVTEVKAGFSMSGLASTVWVLSRWTVVEAVAMQEPLRAVLGSRPDTVTVVTTPPPHEAGQGDRSSSREGSGRPSPGGPGRCLLSRSARGALSGSGSKAFSGRVSAGPSSAELGSGSGGELSYLGFMSSFLAEADSFCFLGAGSSSEDGS